MKTIFIATDFSQASRNAALYGIELAKALHANVILFNAYQVPWPMPESVKIDTPEEVQKLTQVQLEEESKLINPSREVQVETICEFGSPFEAIISMSSKRKADLIIAGMKGSGKGFRKLFGSTATSLTKRTHIPALIVPENAHYTNPESIVFASDLSMDTNLQRLDQLKAITERFQSKLYVVKVVKNKSEEWFEVLNTPQTLKLAVRVLDSEFDYVVGNDITQALNEFVEKHHVNILAILPHKHNWVESLFTKSETKDMLFHTTIPLLVLPEKNYNDDYVSSQAFSKANS